MKIYDGEGMILGRLCTEIAKQVLLGETVKVVNCEKVVVSGRKRVVFKENKERRARKGYPLKSAKLSRLPERYVRRSVRGMLPWKKARGKDAFKRVMCYQGIPAEFTEKKALKVSGAEVKKLPTLYYTTVSEICKHSGGKHEEN